ncbi:MAG TPA: hypothetical protein PK995_03985 [Bacteroidia bacterium]|nr:hypothetical protein [Bacteroidia bacterium]
MPIANLFTSDFVPSGIRKNFNYCYSPSVDYTNSFIKFNGYYIFNNPPYESFFTNFFGDTIKLKKDASFQSFMFFKDGFFVAGDNFVHRKYYEKEFLRKVEQEKQPETKCFSNLYHWGIYRIVGDTIKLQYINHPAVFASWYSIEVWYKKIDDNTLKVVFAKNYFATNDTHRNTRFKEEFIKVEFIETDITLKSNPWLKKKKWIWCNSNEFKDWKNCKNKK